MFEDDIQSWVCLKSQRPETTNVLTIFELICEIETQERDIHLLLYEEEPLKLEISSFLTLLVLILVVIASPLSQIACAFSRMHANEKECT